MAAPRPTWKGYLKLALVSCPIAVFSAVSSTERVRFNQINRQTGNRIRQKLVDEETQEPVATSDKVRGYEIDKGVYVQVEDEELDAIAIDSSQTIDIDVFVPKAEIDVRYLDAPYYVAPNDRVGAEAFVTMREAMQHKGMVAIARVVMAKRERVVVLEPWEKGMLATTLRYPYEVRDASAYFEAVPDTKIEPALITMAEQLIDSRIAAFDSSTFHDRYEEAVIAMIERKKAGLPQEARRTPAKDGAIIDFAEALRKSLEKGGKAPPSSKPAGSAKPTVKAAKGKKRVPGQTEMLMPITGKQTPEKKPATKPVATPSRGRRKAS